MEVIFAGMLLGWRLNSQEMNEVEIESDQTHLNIPDSGGTARGEECKEEVGMNQTMKI